MGIIEIKVTAWAKKQECFCLPTVAQSVRCLNVSLIGSCLVARPINLKTYSRAVIAIAMMVAWSLVDSLGIPALDRAFGAALGLSAFVPGTHEERVGRSASMVQPGRAGRNAAAYHH